MKTLSFDPIRADVAITEKEKSAALHANALLHNGQGAGNDFLGWVGLPSALGEEELQAIETEAARLRDPGGGDPLHRHRRILPGCTRRL